MKTIILCGGLGTRLGIETKKIPKPMVKINNKPILEHIIDNYKKYGFNEFILATGYKHQVIEKYFKKNKFKKIKISWVYTGKLTNTGGRILKLKRFFNKQENFFLTYGDGISNQNFTDLFNFHIKNKKTATITVVRPPARFGEVKLSKNNSVSEFKEKPSVSKGWINGGFFVLNYKIFNYLKKNEIFEKSPLEKLVKKKELIAYKHKGFWQCMDTPRDKEKLSKLLKAKLVNDYEIL